ncbi:MAG TPA: sulfotransferase family protein [Chryseosolibacter sp.]
MILNLISGPRNISTAMMYSFAQRSDTTVLDEPFYAVYLEKSGALHPGRDEVLKSQSTSEDVVRSMIVNHTTSPVLFIKNMAHHMEVMEKPFFDNSVNIFLIRNPKQIIASYAQVIEKPVMRDIGIEYQSKLFEQLARENNKVIVLDTGRVLQNPETVLKKLCDAAGIPFESSMLHWKKGPKPYDGVWASHWYTNVHNSTGFEKQNTSERVLPAHLQTLYEQARGYYEKLLPFSLKA